MKMLIAILTFATLVTTAIVTQPASAAPPDERDSGQSGQSGAYKGYPLRDWYRPDSW